MRKKTIALFFVTSLFLLSCSLEQEKNENYTDFVSSVNRIKDVGLFDEVLSELNKNSRSTQESINIKVPISDVEYFVNHPEEVISELDSNVDRNGFELVNAMYTGATIGEVAEIMAVTSKEMSEEYLNNIEYEINEMSRSLTSSTLSIDTIKNIKLSYYSDEETFSRGPFAGDLEWDTIYWYYGMCGTTIAGLSAYKWGSLWKPWVGVAGLATAAAGGASMGAQLYKWYTCTDFKNFANSLINKDAEEIKNILEWPIGDKLIRISGSTTSVAVFCKKFTPEIYSFVIEGAISTWNSIVEVITFVFPEGSIPEFFGINIKPI